MNARDPAGIRASLETSLRLLQTDYVDLLQFHGAWWDDAAADQILERGGLETYERLRDEGKVRYLGFTAESPNGPVERLIQSGRFDAMLICYNLIYQSAGAYRGREQPPETVLSQARAHQMGISTMRTLTSAVFQRWVSQVAPGVADQVDWSGGTPRVQSLAPAGRRRRRRHALGRGGRPERGRRRERCLPDRHGKPPSRDRVLERKR